MHFTQTLFTFKAATLD